MRAKKKERAPLAKNAAQHSVHPTGGSLRVFKQFVSLGVGSVKVALSRPAHQPVTQAVGRFFEHGQPKASGLFIMENLTSRSLHSRTVLFRFLSKIPLSLKVQDKIYRIVTADSVIESLPPANEVEILIENQVLAGTELFNAHRIWSRDGFLKVETPSNFPRQPNQQLCPPNIFHVDIDCIEKKNPGMGSFFGYTGYYLSVLVSLDSESIWDVRGQKPT